jgi:hypothetical protein
VEGIEDDAQRPSKAVGVRSGLRTQDEKYSGKLRNDLGDKRIDIGSRLALTKSTDPLLLIANS